MCHKLHNIPGWGAAELQRFQTRFSAVDRCMCRIFFPGQGDGAVKRVVFVTKYYVAIAKG